MRALKNLYLVRHGESTANAASQPETRARYADWKASAFVNTRLTERGRAQAAEVSLDAELVLVSPLRRAMETYTCSRIRAARLITSPLAREFCAYGPSCFLENEPQTPETPQQLAQRIERLILLLREQPETTIAIVSHGVLIAELLRRLGHPLTHSPRNAECIHLPAVLV